MKEPTVVRLDETERVSFGPLSHYQPIIGDDAGTTPGRFVNECGQIGVTQSAPCPGTRIGPPAARL